MWPYLPQTKMRSHLCILALYYLKSVIIIIMLMTDLGLLIATVCIGGLWN